MIGRKLAHYEITAKIGAGGMGEVFRATDTKLGREVALKFLPESVSADPERLARFEREARVLASLHHPHIAVIHGLEEVESQRFLVLELVDGEDLSQHLKQGALSIDESLRLAVQVAEALEAAHESGIVHRDLKPGNIKIDRQGNVKVLDFGLAKAAEAAEQPDLTRSPTMLGNSPTVQGVIMGTAAYMAPEQARGQAVDKRADIFAFGCVLFEMLTGRQTFAGDTVSDLLASVLKVEPNLETLPEATPPAVRRLLRRCLDKDPQQRLRDIGEARILLQGVLSGDVDEEAGGVAAATVAREAQGRRLRLPWFLAAVFALVSVSLAWRTFSPRPVEMVPTFATINPPEGTTLLSTGIVAGPVAVSPDGRRLAFVARDPSGSALWVRHLQEAAARRLEGTEGAYRPFWSHDGRQLGFFAGGKLKKIAAGGGPVFNIADTPDARGGTWSQDNTILFTPNYVGPVFRVSASGGSAQPVTEVNRDIGEATHRYPSFLPDGRHFLYSSRASTSGAGREPDVYLAALDGSQQRLLLRDAVSPIYASGYLLFLKGTTLVAQRFDPQGLDLQGEAVPVIQDVRLDHRFSRGVFAASQTGVLAYQVGQDHVGVLTWFDRAGNPVGTVGEPGMYGSPAISPDGRSVALHVLDPGSGQGDVWVHDLERDMRTRLTFNDADEGSPVWSHDGQTIYFAGWRSNRQQIYRKPSSGAGQDELVLGGDADYFVDSILPDDSGLICMKEDGTGENLVMVPLHGASREPVPILSTQAAEWDARISPDGRWLAYTSDESGRAEVYVMSFPGPGGRWQVSTAGGDEPRWRRDGGELYYMQLDGTLMAARVEASGSSFAVRGVEPLFRASLASTTGWRYDVRADGQRFVVNTTITDEHEAPIHLVLDWPALLSQR